jgi:hypothetical protein
MLATIKFASLEVAGSAAPLKEITALQCLWMRKLQSREMGLNTSNRACHWPVRSLSCLTGDPCMSPGGREGTRQEFAKLLGVARFSLIRVVPTDAPVSIFEARPA